MKKQLDEKEKSLCQLQKATSVKLALFQANMRNKGTAGDIPPFKACFQDILINVKHLRELRSKCDDIYDDSKLVEIIENVSANELNFVLNSMEEFHHVQNEQENLKIQQELIVKCAEKEDLLDLLDERDHIFRKCIKRIRALLKQVDALPLKERDDELKTALDFIQNNFTEYINDTNASLTDALAEYKNERSNLTRDVSISRDQTNEKSSQLFKVFGQMQRELHCMLSVNVTTDISNTDQLVTDYKQAIHKEIKVTEVGEIIVDHNHAKNNFNYIH